MTKKTNEHTQLEKLGFLDEVEGWIEWLGYAPSGRRIGRVINPGGTAFYVTLNTTPGIRYRYSVVYDTKDNIHDVLHALVLDNERLTASSYSGTARAEKTNRDHFGRSSKDE